MKFSLLLLTMVLSTSVMTKQHSSFTFMMNNDDEDTPTKPTWTREEMVNWYVAASRGLWVGFVEGLYNIQTAEISEHCLNKETTSRIFRIFDAFLTFKIGDMFHAIVDSANIINNINECEFERIDHDLTGFCIKNDCSY